MKGVLANAIKAREEYKSSGAWLHDAIPFKGGFYLDEESKIKAIQLFRSLKLETGYKIEQKQKDFEVLIANLLDQTKKPVRISLNQNDWKRTKYNQVSYSIIDLIQILYKKKLIEMKTGFNAEQSRMTRIWATEKLLEYFPEYRSCVLFKPVELVELTDEKRNLIEYKDTAETNRIRKILQKANSVNEKAEIVHTAENRVLKLKTGLVAIFKGKLTLYGRLHTRGISGYQGLSSEERQDITINDNKTIELDFKGLHPYLLYSNEGAQYIGDPYSIIESNPICRPFLKQILLSLLNSKNETQAEKASNNWLFENHSEREQLKTIGITKARPLINAFKEAHKPIAHYFCSGKETGLRIMNKDSKIAIDIINHFSKQNIPILCIHDSFIVENIYKDELYRIMKQMYAKHTGGFRCFVK